MLLTWILFHYFMIFSDFDFIFILMYCYLLVGINELIFLFEKNKRKKIKENKEKKNRWNLGLYLTIKNIDSCYKIISLLFIFHFIHIFLLLI